MHCAACGVARAGRNQELQQRHPRGLHHLGPLDDIRPDKSGKFIRRIRDDFQAVGSKPLFGARCAQRVCGFLIEPVDDVLRHTYAREQAVPLL